MSSNTATTARPASTTQPCCAATTTATSPNSAGPCTSKTANPNGYPRPGSLDTPPKELRRPGPRNGSRPGGVYVPCAERSSCLYSRSRVAGARCPRPSRRTHHPRRSRLTAFDRLASPFDRPASPARRAYRTLPAPHRCVPTRSGRSSAWSASRAERVTGVHLPTDVASSLARLIVRAPAALGRPERCAIASGRLVTLVRFRYRDAAVVDVAESSPRCGAVYIGRHAVWCRDWWPTSSPD